MFKLAWVVHELRGTATWSSALVVNRNVLRLESTCSLACLVVSCISCTVLKAAVYVLMGMLPSARSRERNCVDHQNIVKWQIFWDSFSEELTGTSAHSECVHVDE